MLFLVLDSYPRNMHNLEAGDQFSLHSTFLMCASVVQPNTLSLLTSVGLHVHNSNGGRPLFDIDGLRFMSRVVVPIAPVHR